MCQRYIASGPGSPKRVVVWIAQAPDDLVGETMVTQAQEWDGKIIAGIYKSNHPEDEGGLASDVRQETQTFIARDDESRVVGFAMVIRLDCGVSPYGIIHQMEIAPACSARNRPEVRDSLAEACRSWL